MAIYQTSHITTRFDDGRTCEEYFHHRLPLYDRVPDRQDGPAKIWRGADGSILTEEYYREGKRVNKEDLAPLVKRPIPNTDASGAPSPS